MKANGKIREDCRRDRFGEAARGAKRCIYHETKQLNRATNQAVNADITDAILPGILGRAANSQFKQQDLPVDPHPSQADPRIRRRMESG
jgi:hypothetical protein